jgi:glycosyltransferase involved in cell wall biosynthesis
MSDPGSLGVVLVTLLDLGANTGGPRRARQLARLCAGAGARAHLVGYREPAVVAETIAAPLAADGVATTLIARAAASAGHRFRYTAGLPWSGSEKTELLRAVGAALDATGARVLLLYNQDVIAARALAGLARARGVAFVAHHAEAHLPSDFPLGLLTGRWWNERQHLRSTPRFADGHLVISRWLEEAVRERGGAETLRLPSFVDVAEWERRFAAAPPTAAGGEPRLVYVGDGARRDCVPLIAAGLAVARSRGLRCGASFVGVQGVKGAECFPRANPAELAAHYRAADAFILLRSDDQSSRACLPTRLGELLLTGKPVIVSDLPDYNLHVRERDNGYVVRGSAAVAVAEAIQAALARTPENAAIGARGRATALATFDWRAHRGAVAAWCARLVKTKN